MKRKPTAVQAYLDARVPFGGEMWRRGDVILYLQGMGVTGRAKDLFMFGLDQATTRLGGCRPSSPS